LTLSNSGARTAFPAPARSKGVFPYRAWRAPERARRGDRLAVRALHRPDGTEETMHDAAINVGDTAEAGFTVTYADTAAALSISTEDSFPEVFATARMVAIMELAAARVLRPHLLDGELSVGVSLDVRHTAATPVGSTVKAIATYLGPEGKLFRFKVEAFDDAGPIGEGTHVRAIISNERLLAGAAKRKR
jgi:predicted thioesterase